MINTVLELLKTREKTYMKLTEEAMKIFINELKEALEKEFYDGKTVELFLTDLNIMPQNFRFARVDGKLNTNDIGEIIDTDTGKVEITLENLWDYSKPLSLIIPMSLLDNADVDGLRNYLREVKNNSDRIPASIVEQNRIADKDKSHAEFTKIDKELDEAQLMALKLVKSVSVH